MMRKNAGFNMIELMVAIATSATIIATIITSFSKLYNLFLYNTKYLAVNQELRIAMQVMKNDLNNAGVFGAYSVHNQTTNNFENISLSNSAINCGNDPSITSPLEKCSFDLDTVGVRSFEHDDTSITSASVLAGYQITSDVLRVQFGNDKPSELQAVDGKGKSIINYCEANAQYVLNQLVFPSINTDLDVSYPFMILASANHAYLLQSNQTDKIVTGTTPPYILDMKNNITTGCPIDAMSGIKVTPTIIRLEDTMHGGKPGPGGGRQTVASLKYDSTDPDIHSMSLVNLYTSYYFVGKSPNNESGLFVVRQQSDMKLSQPELVSSAVKTMHVEFMLDNLMNFNRVQNATLGRFTLCSTSQMGNGGDIRCKDMWDKIVAVNITLSGAGYSSQMSADQFEQQFTDTVGWLS